jgi:S1-C subfamily serine protease
MRKALFLKSVLTAIMLLMLISNAHPQRITPNPRVDSDSFDESSQMRITSVITNEEVTLVTFQYATTMFKSWISLNEKTALTTNQSNTRLGVLEWGIITQEDNDLVFNALQFGKQFFVKRRTAYNLYMVFPVIPATATSLNIVEPDGFFWRGIHINNETTEGISKGGQGRKSDYPQGRSGGGFQPTGSGSGFALSRDGYVATCYHVIEGARTIQIKGVSGNFETAYRARVVASDEQHDIAILKIDDARLQQIPYACVATLSDVGENVFVLGYPQTQHLGEELKLTTGVISSRSGYRGDATTYQISAQALPGNSGGPLFDNAGQVIGVVSAKYIEPNVSYAVKSTFLKTLIENSNIKLNQPVSNAVSSKTLADKVKSIRNFIYIIEVES